MSATACGLLKGIVAYLSAGFSHGHFIAIATVFSIVAIYCAKNGKCIVFLNKHIDYVIGITTAIIVFGVCYSISYNGFSKFFNLSFGSILEIFTIVFLVMLLTQRREMKIHRIEMLSTTIDSIDKMFNDINQEYERLCADDSYKRLQLLVEQQKIYLLL